MTGRVVTVQRALVVREVAFQMLAIGLTVIAATVGDAGLAAVVLIPATVVILVARLRWPAATTLAVGGLLTFIAPGLWLAAALSAFAEGRRETSQRQLRLVLATAGVLCLATTPLTGGAQNLFPRLGTAVAAAVFLLVVPALCGALIGQRRPAAQLLTERNTYLERAQALTASQARWEERARITAEMHDVLGHRLSLLSVHAGALELATEDEAPRLSEQANLVRSIAAAALDELRATLAATGNTPEQPSRPSTGAPGGEEGLAAVAEHWRQAGLEVAVAWAGDEPLDPRVERAVDRAVREGLTNAHKHAPGTAVTVTVRTTPQRVRASIHNTTPARGTPEGPGTRLGLLGLAERARLLGGHAFWGPTEDGGFELAVDVPSQPRPALETGWATTPPTAASLPVPPPMQQADVLTWRRVAVVVMVAVAVPLAVALTAALG